MDLQKLSTLSDDAWTVALLLADGHSVRHAQTVFEPGASVDLNGQIPIVDGRVHLDVTAAVMEEIESTDLPAHTYQPSSNAEWQTCFPYGQRSQLLVNLLKAFAQHIRFKHDALFNGNSVDEHTVASAFGPIVELLSAKIIDEGYNPFDPHHGFSWFDRVDSEGGKWISIFKECVDEYTADPGKTKPGETAIRCILEEEGLTRSWDNNDIEPVRLTKLSTEDDEDDEDDDEELPVFEWLEDFVEKCLEGTEYDSSLVVEILSSTIKDQATEGWIEEAVERGIPGGVHAEFVYFPTWTPDITNLDDAIYHLSLRSSGNSTYLDEIQPCEGLKRFLSYLNVSTEELIAATTERNPAEGAKLAANLEGFQVEANPNAPKLVSPADVVTMIENTGSLNAIPTIHAHINLGKLFKMDTNKPIEIPLRKQEISIGLHDFVNGGGYMDTYPGTATINLTQHHFAGDKYSYGINETYGLALSCFYCDPHNIDVQDEPDEAPEIPRPRG